MTVVRSGAPTSSLERDARRINDAHAGEVKPGDIAVGVIIARTSEAFDFLVYAIASVVVFPQARLSVHGRVDGHAVLVRDIFAGVRRPPARHRDLHGNRSHLRTRR